MGKHIRDYQIDQYIDDENEYHQYDKKRKIKKFKKSEEYVK